MQDSSANTLTEDLFRVYLDDGWSLVVTVSPWIVGAIIVFVGLVVWRGWKPWRRHRYRAVSVDIQLGGIGKASFKPNVQDVQIAHRIWTELITRKVAVPFKPDEDVITEVYDSWYEMFGRIRQLIADIPAELVRDEVGTRTLVRIATQTLSDGVRPHLTRWQADFRNWYAHQENSLKKRSPQDVQTEYPRYQELLADLERVNKELIQYASELKKVVDG